MFGAFQKSNGWGPAETCRTESATRSMRLLLAVCAAAAVCVSVYAQPAETAVPSAKILSPLPGSWNNKQALVLEVPDGCEVFYSVMGTNPIESGFAYDGPVFLDVSGEVYLSLVTVSDAGVVTDAVSFSVYEQPAPESVAALFESPVYEYYPGSTIVFPSDMHIAVGDTPAGEDAYIPAGKLSLDASNALERFVPCSLYTKDAAYHFVIHAGAASGTALAEPDVPFRLEDWENLWLTDRRYIYSIDGGDWFGASEEPVLLDRAGSHVIQWQSVAFNAGNPVYRYDLPAKPELEVSPAAPAGKTYSSAVFISVLQPDDSAAGGYTFSFDDSAEPENLYSTICADIFPGEELSEELSVTVFQNGLYQGKMQVSVSIDKKPPRPPVISALDETPFYSRKPILLNFITEKGGSVYYEVQAVKQTEGFDSLALDSTLLSRKPADRYNLLREQTVELSGDAAQAVLYTVFAYARDAAGNKSTPSAFTAIVDRCNYYIDPDAEYADGALFPPDGSLAYPFTEFADVVPIINSQEFTRVYVKGMVPLSSNTALSSDCEIISRDRAVFSFSAESPIVVRSGDVRIKNCAFEYTVNSESSYSQSMFSLKKASLSFDSCSFTTSFGSNGVLFNCADSVLLLDGCSASVQAQIYVSLVSGTNSDITVQDTDISLIGSTAVCFSLDGGTFSLYDTDAKVITRLGRIAELSTVEARLARNLFTIEFQDTVPRGFRSAAIWKNRMTDILEDTGNRINGFQNFQDTL